MWQINHVLCRFAVAASLHEKKAIKNYVLFRFISFLAIFLSQLKSLLAASPSSGQRHGEGGVKSEGSGGEGGALIKCA